MAGQFGNAPSQLQTGLGAGIAGFFGGMSKGRDAELGRQEKEAYLESMMNKQARMDAEKAKREEAAQTAQFKRSMMPGSEVEGIVDTKKYQINPMSDYQPSVVSAMIAAETGLKKAAMPRPTAPKDFDMDANRKAADNAGLQAAKLAGAMDDDPKTWSPQQVNAWNAGRADFWKGSATQYNKLNPQRAVPLEIGGNIVMEPEAEVPNTGPLGFNFFNDVKPEARTVAPFGGGRPAPMADAITNTSAGRRRLAGLGLTRTAKP